MNIEGPRYNCERCKSLDMCGRCYSNGAHAHHPFLRYDTPGARAVYLPALSPPGANKVGVLGGGNPAEEYDEFDC